jgi:hypothetical protein
MHKVALGRVFVEYFGFPCQSSFHQILHHHNHLGQATIGQSVAAVDPVGLHPPLRELELNILEDNTKLNLRERDFGYVKWNMAYAGYSGS